MERIDRALARIENQATSLSSGGDDAELAARHEALRGNVEKTLTVLDELIAEIEG